MAETAYPLHAQQMEAFASSARYRVIAAGRRWGKTHYGIARLLRGASERPGVPYWYIAPTWKQARDIAWRPLLGRVPKTWLVRAPNESRLEVQLVGGVVIGLRGADDPDSLRGRGLGGVVLDEYADVKPTVWDEIIQPSLLDTGGWADFLGTPKGFDHFYDVYQQGQSAAFPEWASWQFRTAEAPHIVAGELAAIRRAYEQRGQGRLYLQEFEASFESNAGYILGALWKPSHTVTLADEALRAAGLSVGTVMPWHVVEDVRWTPKPEHLVFGSVDYGYGAPWAAYLHAALVGGHTRTFREWYGREVRDVDQARDLRATVEHLMGQGMHRPEWFVLDPAMWASRRETGLAKSVAEVYEDEFGGPLNIPLMPGSGGRAARLSRPQRWLAALSTAPDGLPWHTVTSACPHLIRTVPRVPWDKDDPEVEDGDSDNHAYESCLAEGERVETARGPMPIEDVRVGDEVLTRAGYRAVLKTWDRGVRDVWTLTAEDGRTLTATPDHELLTVEGWKRVDELSCADILFAHAIWQTRHGSSAPRFRNGAGNGITAPGRTLRGNRAASPFVLADSIGMCGRTWSARFLRGCTFTISTAIGPTMRGTIWPSFLPPLIWGSTVRTPPSASGRRGARTWPWRLGLGWRWRRCMTVGALGVAQRLQPRGRDGNGPVRDDVSSLSTRRRGIRGAILIAWWRARGVTACLRLAEKGSGSAAIRRVIGVQPSGGARVYDLTVAQDHEFFASGLLVHNCGRFFEARPHFPMAKDADPLAHLVHDPISLAHARVRERKAVAKRIAGRLNMRSLGTP